MESKAKALFYLGIKASDPMLTLILVETILLKARLGIGSDK